MKKRSNILIVEIITGNHMELKVRGNYKKYIRISRKCENMKKRILEYVRYIDEILKNNPEGTDYEELRGEHLVQIGFFKHERLIHLIVTVTFALLEMAALITAVMVERPAFLAMVAAIFILLVPYIAHYYLLENNVQYMYKQYDEIYKRAKEQKITGSQST